MDSKSLQFEYWFRHILPKQLNLSDSKSAALESIMCMFADYVRPLEKKAPREFDLYFSKLKAVVEKASKSRKPYGYVIQNGHYVPLSKEQLGYLVEDRKRRKKETKKWKENERKAAELLHIISKWDICEAIKKGASTNIYSSGVKIILAELGKCTSSRDVSRLVSQALSKEFYRRYTIKQCLNVGKEVFLWAQKYK